MPPNPVQATEALARGLRTEFVETYRAFNAQMEPRVSMLMEMDVPSDKSSELYAYFESAPHPVRWPRGEELPTDTFRARDYTVTNHDWARGIDWHDNDEQDDQTRSLVDRARGLGANFALIPERVTFQLLLGAVDLDLLPAVPNAPDGVGLFSAVDGAGAARFGAVGGNVLAGGGVATVNAITGDFFTSLSRFKLFQDTKGQPLWNESFLTSFLIIYGSANERRFREAFAGTTVQGTQAGISNVIRESGLQFALWSTPRITDNDWFIVVTSVPQRPLLRQVRQGVRDNMEDFANSDRTRRTKYRRLQWDARFGFGINLPYQIIQVDN